ncbi:aspartate kinase [Patescibacteria group bacterium]|nr:aspartate kinase [Patescibacteria group bacterium]
MRSIDILKFGGTSMADAKAMEQSASVVSEAHRKEGSVLSIVSAMSGVTDQLKSVIKKGLEGRDYWDLMREIAGRHVELIEQAVESHEVDPLEKAAQEQVFQTHKYIEAMRTLNLGSSPHLDWISSLGERLVAPVFAAHLRGRGIGAVYYDAADVLITDGNFGNANLLVTSTREQIKDSVVRDLGGNKVVVMGGYYGADRNRKYTTFSRGGSDLTATAMGHTLTPWFDPISVYLYKADVAGVMSSDPSIVPNAHVIPHMSYEEAAAFTVYGGKVIHPKAVHHAVRSGSSKRLPFSIFVKSTLEPYLPGTLIDNQMKSEDDPIKAVSLIKSAVRLTVKGWGMDRPGIMRKITGALAKGGIDIDFIGQPHSKLALDLAFQFDGSEFELGEAIREELKEEIRANDIDIVKAMRVGVIGVIGRGISDPQILKRVIDGMNGNFPELRKPDAYKLTTGEYEASILIDLSEDRLKVLTQSIHDSVFARVAA